MAVIPKGQRACWDCNGAGTVITWIRGKGVEITCGSCGGTGEK